MTWLVAAIATTALGCSPEAGRAIADPNDSTSPGLDMVSLDRFTDMEADLSTSDASDADASTDADPQHTHRQDTGMPDSRPDSLLDGSSNRFILESNCGPDEPMEWIDHEGGDFILGVDRGRVAQPPIAVSLSSFSISRTEVTRGQYDRCVSAGACSPPGGTALRLCLGGADVFSECGNLPVRCVTWRQACEYAKWVGGRLPTIAEFEYAARSGGHFEYYPWGDSEVETCEHAIVDLLSDGRRSSGCEAGEPWPVCSRPHGNSDAGVCDLIGNLFEWLSDSFDVLTQEQADALGCDALADWRARRGSAFSTVGFRATDTAIGAAPIAHPDTGIRVVLPLYER